MSLRASFVDRFGEDAASRLEEAADAHENYRQAETDQFKLAVLIVIAYRCVGEAHYRKTHELVGVTYDGLYSWAVGRGDPQILAMLYDPDHLALTQDAITKEYA